MLQEKKSWRHKSNYSALVMHLGFFLHLAFAHFPLPSDSDKKSNEAESSLGSFGCDLQVLSSLSLT